MKKTTVSISLLAITLFATNTWWAFRFLDAGISYTYQGASLHDSQQALSQSLAIIKVLGTNRCSLSQIVEATQKALPST